MLRTTYLPRSQFGDQNVIMDWSDLVRTELDK